MRWRPRPLNFSPHPIDFAASLSSKTSVQILKRQKRGGQLARCSMHGASCHTEATKGQECSMQMRNRLVAANSTYLQTFKKRRGLHGSHQGQPLSRFLNTRQGDQASQVPSSDDGVARPGTVQKGMAGADRFPRNLHVMQLQAI